METGKVFVSLMKYLVVFGAFCWVTEAAMYFDNPVIFGWSVIPLLMSAELKERK